MHSLSVRNQHGEVVFSDDPRLVAQSALIRAKRFAFGAMAVALPMTLTACMGAAPATKGMPPKPPAPMATDAAPQADAGAPTPAPLPVAK